MTVEISSSMSDTGISTGASTDSENPLIDRSRKKGLLREERQDVACTNAG